MNFTKSSRSCSGGALVLVEHLVPDVLDQDHLAERGGERNQLLDLLAATLLDLFRRAVVGMADDDQDAAAAGSVRHAQTVLDVGSSGRRAPLLGIGERIASNGRG